MKCPECGAETRYWEDGRLVTLEQIRSRVVAPERITKTMSHQLWCARGREES